MLRRAGRDGACDGLGHISDSPIDKSAERWIGIWQQRQLVAADIETDLERLIEVRLDADEFGPPLLGPVEVRCRVNDGAKSFK